MPRDNQLCNPSAVCRLGTSRKTLRSENWEYFERLGVVQTCYIPQELAAFLLELRSDGPRYSAYTAWKHARPLVIAPGFRDALRDDALRSGAHGLACRLCRFVANGTAR